ncbi:hypothetical protein ACHAWF_006191 [Thalassiosira exigua]
MSRKPFDGVGFAEEDYDFGMGQDDDRGDADDESIGLWRNDDNDNDVDAAPSRENGGQNSNSSSLKRVIILFILLSVVFLIGRTSAPASHEKGGSSFDAWLARAGPTPAHLARNVRPVVDLPTASSPFAFFHLRKAGGSTLRFAIYDAAIKHGLAKNTLFVPCRYPKDCVSFDRIPRDTFKAVYASHMNYEELVRARREVKQLDRAKNPQYQDHLTLANGKEQTTYYHLDDDIHHFDCLANLRPTVPRVVSCYNYRFKQSNARKAGFKMPYADELTPEDWASLLLEAYDIYAAGCNNEIYRAFGSINDETIINTIARDSPYFDQELQRASSRMAQCVVVILDRCEDSNAVLRHYLPWLGEGLDLCATHANAGHTAGVHKGIQEGSADAILKQNEMDEALFQFGRELFEEQVRISKSA